MREESEGYAKLAVELATNMGPAHDPLTGKSVETPAQRTARAKRVNEAVQSIIGKHTPRPVGSLLGCQLIRVVVSSGNFDLDPDRTLDLVLDTFSSQLTYHWQFFVDLLHHSPWAPRPSIAESDSGKGKAKEAGVQIGLEGDEGSRLLAQILGFKFAFYQTQEEDAPDKLYLMAALLIWHGFVKLGDLWPHVSSDLGHDTTRPSVLTCFPPAPQLTPDDATLAKTEDNYRAEQDRKAAAVGGGNALAMAAALADDEDEDPATAASKKAQNAATSAAAAAAAPAPARPPPHQRLALLRALLSIGDVTHALFILSTCPALVPAHPDLGALLNRLLAVALGPALAPVSFAAAHPDAAAHLACKRANFPRLGPRLTTDALEKVVAGTEFAFFFPAWQERIPKAGEVDEVLDRLELILPFTGVLIVRDFTLYSKILRLLRHDFATSGTAGPANARSTRWLTLFRSYLLPALSLLSDNSAAALELWQVLKLLSIEQRFALYGEWKDTLYRRIPALSVRKAEAERDIKMLLRRLSTDNVKKLGKSFAKIAHTNPTVVFQIALHQVQSYDNLVGPVVDAARYLTEFGFDVLAYSLLDALSGSKSKVKEDGTSVALWLSSLAAFTGRLYQRWNSMASSLPVILQYLVNQLVSGSTKDLIVLREIVTRMTGLEPFADLSDAQVMSLAGGPVLRSEVFNQTDLSTGAKKTQAQSQQAGRDRLRQALAGSGLGVPLLVSIAWQRQVCVAGAETHLKSLGALFDQCHAVLFQYQELLTAVFSPEQLAEMLPTVSDLLGRGFEAAVAFDMSRPKLRLAMRTYDDEEKAKAKAKSAALAAKLAQAKLTKAMPSAESVKEEVETPTGVGKVTETSGELAVPGAQAAGEDVGMAEAEAEVLALAAPNSNNLIAEMDAPASPKPAASAWHPGLAELIVDVDEFVPRRAREVMGPAFFVTFWQLTLSDIHYPKDRYEQEHARLLQLSRAAMDSPAIGAGDRSGFVDSILKLASKVVDEMQRHSQASTATKRRLSREKLAWFPDMDTKTKRLELVQQILQHCVQPRARVSLPDAAFAYQFVKRMHAINTPGFHTLVFYDQLLNSQVAPILYSCSENEARNYARFLFDVLSDVHKWFSSGRDYKEDAVGQNLQGFMRTLSRAGAADLTDKDWFSHDDYKRIATNWHAHVARGFVEAFETGEYMHIKNSILVLTKLAPVFPIQWEHGVKLEDAVGALLKVEKREDLKILAQGYKAVLGMRKKSWVGRPKPEHKKEDVKPTPKEAEPVREKVKEKEPAKPAAAANGAPSRGLAIPISAAAAALAASAARGLPARPDSRSNGRAAAAEAKAAEAAKVMDVDPPKRSEGGANGSSNGLPARPGPGDRRGVPAGVKADDNKGGRQEPVRRDTAPMDPPPKPAAGGGRGAPSQPSSRRPSPTPSSRDGRGDSRRDDRDRAAAADSRSRAPSEAGSAHSSRDQREREKERERERDPSRSSTRGDREDRSARSSRAGRGGDARDAPREDERRRRDDDRRGGRGSAVHERDRGATPRDREREREVRDTPKETSRRARSPVREVRDERDRPSHGNSRTAGRQDPGPPAALAAADRAAQTPTGPRADRPPPASSTSSTALPSHLDAGRESAAAEPAASASQPRGDRLKPAPAVRVASGTGSASGSGAATPTASGAGREESPNAAFSIKGRGSLGTSRLLDQALDSRPPAGGGRASARGASGVREDDRERDGAGRKRPASVAGPPGGGSGALFDRLNGGGGGAGGEERRGEGGSSLPKRPRMDERDSGRRDSRGGDPRDRDEDRDRGRRFGGSGGGGGGGGGGGRRR